MSSEWIGGAVLLAVVAYNVYVTRMIWRSEEFERPQQIGQTAFVWLVPLIGATVVKNVLRPDTRVYRGGDESDG